VTKREGLIRLTLILAFGIGWGYGAYVYAAIWLAENCPSGSCSGIIILLQMMASSVHIILAISLWIFGGVLITTVIAAMPFPQSK
jgi:hypothetical protein